MKRQFLTKKKILKHSKKTLKYHKAQESLRSENHANNYLCKGIILNVFLYPEGYYTRTK